ncbi:MAG: hypothetical protein OEZ36_12820 [Spirochaetota bacterium]|nr:hypothetical protein [Spirochaetota bacterium]
MGTVRAVPIPGMSPGGDQELRDFDTIDEIISILYPRRFVTPEAILFHRAFYRVIYGKLYEFRTSSGRMNGGNSPGLQMDKPLIAQKLTGVLRMTIE